MDQTSLRKCTVSPEPSISTYFSHEGNMAYICSFAIAFDSRKNERKRSTGNLVLIAFSTPKSTSTSYVDAITLDSYATVVVLVKERKRKIVKLEEPVI